MQSDEDTMDQKHDEPEFPLPPITRLPPELITHVFSFLTEREHQWAALMVCKSWFSVTVDTLWFRPNISKQDTLDKLLYTLDQDPDALTVDYSSLIRRLNLINVASTVNDDMVLRMTACSKLERLTLSGCSQLSDTSLIPLLERNKGILSVDMTNLDSVTDKSLVSLATNCPKLQGLYASGCKNLTDVAIDSLAHNCPSLKRMKLNGCNHITDDAIRNLIVRCPLLVEFDLTSCTNMLDETASMAFTHLSQLREYRVALNINITDQALLTLPPKVVYDKLRIIDFSGCPLVTDDGIAKLIAVAPRLRNVVLAKCYNISDRGLAHLAKLGRNLHYMHLGHCNNITNLGVSNLVKACNRIQYIDVACCNQLQDQAVRDIAQLPKLRRVGLVKCQNVTDVGIQAFTFRVGSENTLERIHLSYCSNISLNAITELVNACPRLTHLSLTGVPAFMRDDLLQFCRAPPPEFTQHQQQVFCVFSNTGVKRLRDHLNMLAEQTRLGAAAFNSQVLIGERNLMMGAAPLWPGVLPQDEDVVDIQRDFQEGWGAAMRNVLEDLDRRGGPANGGPGQEDQGVRQPPLNDPNVRNAIYEAELNLLRQITQQAGGAGNIGPVNGARLPPVGRIRMMMAHAQQMMMMHPEEAGAQQQGNQVEAAGPEENVDEDIAMDDA